MQVRMVYGPKVDLSVIAHVCENGQLYQDVGSWKLNYKGDILNVVSCAEVDISCCVQDH